MARGGPGQAPPTTGGLRGEDSPLRGVWEAPHPTIRPRSLSVFIGHRQNEPGKRPLRTIGGRRPARVRSALYNAVLMLLRRRPPRGGQGGIQSRKGFTFEVHGGGSRPPYRFFSDCGILSTDIDAIKKARKYKGKVREAP